MFREQREMRGELCGIVLLYLGTAHATEKMIKTDSFSLLAFSGFRIDDGKRYTNK